MKTELYQSMGLIFCAFIILIIIIERYFTSKNTGKKNLFFIFLLIDCFILAITNFLYMYFIYKYLNFSSIDEKTVFLICRIDCFFNILSTYITAVYAYSKSNIKNKNYPLITGIFAIVFTIFIYLLYKSQILIIAKHGFYLYLFLNDIVIYGGAAIPLIYVCILVFAKKIELDKSQKLVIIFMALLLVSILVYQIVFDVDYNAMGFISIALIITLYFTIESQDNQKAKLLIKYKNDNEIMANKSKKFIEKAFNGMTIPMNAMLCVGDVLYRNQNMNDSEKIDSLNDIKLSADQLLRIMSSTKLVYKIQKNELEIKQDTYLLKSLIMNINNYVKSIIRENNKFSLVFNPNMPNTYKGDYENILSLVENVITPLIESEDAGFVTLNIDSKQDDFKTYITFILSSSIKKINSVLFEENATNELEYSLTEIGYVIFGKLVNLLGVEVNINEDKKILTFNVHQIVISNTPIGELDLNGGEKHE